MEKDLLYLKELTVLFAEDDPIVRQQIGSLLSIFFAKVIVAENGKKAFELYEDEQPDIILSDLKMPVADGFAFFEMIRKRDHTTPIIALSAFSERDVLLQCRD